MHPRDAFIRLSAVVIAWGFALPESGWSQTPAPAAVEAFACFVGAAKRSGEGESSAALVGGALLCQQPTMRPVAWFGAHQPPGEKARYLYLLLFKTPKDFDSRGEVAFSAAGAATETGSHSRMSVTLAGKQIDVDYRFDTDETLSRIIAQSLVLDGKEALAADAGDHAPRVFVVNLTKETVEFRPVNVPLPKEVPDLTLDNHDLWGATLKRVTQHLRENSPELQKELAPNEEQP